MSDSAIETRSFNEVYVRDDNSAWARLLWDKCGRVIILSGYGHWSYYWGDRGDYTVQEFLANLDIQYMGKKMMGTNLEEYDAEGTVQCVKEHITRDRRTGELDKEAARKMFDEIGEYGDFWDRHDFVEWGRDQQHYPDWYEFARESVCSEWQNFWDRLWVPLIQPILKASSK
jgi:hypothetical protein